MSCIIVSLSLCSIKRGTIILGWDALYKRFHIKNEGEGEGEVAVFSAKRWVGIAAVAKH